MTQTGIFEGRTRVRYGYSCFGWTRGGGKTWHGGSDEEGLDSTAIRMPYYNAADGTRKPITGKVIQARMVTNRANLTWEWGWYVTVQLDANQTPDAVNFLYFCHNAQNLVKIGQNVKSGDALAVMGNTGNAAQADPPFKHCHFEVRSTSTGRGVDPTAYVGHPNQPGTYGSAEETVADKRLQTITVGPVSQGDADAVLLTCKARSLTDAGLYVSKWANEEKTLQTIKVGPVSQGDADAVLAVCVQRGLDKQKLYTSQWADEVED